MSENGKILGALVLGAAAGAVLGMLFAPSKGSELRDKIKDGTGDLIDELTEKIKQGKETLTDLKEKGMQLKSEAEGAIDNAPEYFEKLKSQLADMLKANFPDAEATINDVLGKKPDAPSPTTEG